MFKKGDRVIVVQVIHDSRNVLNEIGTVLLKKNKGEQILIEFDNNIGGHSGEGAYDGKHGHCWWVNHKALEKTDEKPLNIKARITKMCEYVYDMKTT